MPSLLSTQTYGQSTSDIYAAVKQSTVDKVVQDAQYPITLIDQWWPFSGNIMAITNRAISRKEGEDYLAKAKTMNCSAHAKELACGVLAAYTTRDQQIENIRRQREQVVKSGKKWNGPDDDSLQAMEKESLEFRAHLAHLKINLQKAPSISISGVATVVKNVSLDVDAIGELWFKHPAWNCTKTCSIGPIVFCCEGHFDDVWDKVLEVDVSDAKFAVDATVTFSSDGILVYGTPSVQNFALDYPILRDINLAPIANSVLAGKNFLIMDASKIVAAVPYVNNKYTISSVTLSGNGEIRADIVIQKVP
jgi:hypothetical protein